MDFIIYYNFRDHFAPIVPKARKYNGLDYFYPPDVPMGHNTINAFSVLISIVQIPVFCSIGTFGG